MNRPKWLELLLLVAYLGIPAIIGGALAITMLRQVDWPGWVELPIAMASVPVSWAVCLFGLVALEHWKARRRD